MHTAYGSQDRIELINIGPLMTESILHDTLEEDFQIHEAPHWKVFGNAPFEYTLEKLQSGEPQHWYTYLILQKSDRRVIGFGGFNGQPDDEGRVTIGYAIADNYRKKGYATEAAENLIHIAEQADEVKKVGALTEPHRGPATRVLEKLGFEFIETRHSDEDGDVYYWELELKE